MDQVIHKTKNPKEGKMKKISKYILALTIAGSMSTASLYGQESQTYDASYNGASAGLSAATGWWAWLGIGAAVAGIVVIAANNNSGTTHS